MADNIFKEMDFSWTGFRRFISINMLDMRNQLYRLATIIFGFETNHISLGQAQEVFHH